MTKELCKSDDSDLFDLDESEMMMRMIMPMMEEE